MVRVDRRPRWVGMAVSPAFFKGMEKWVFGDMITSTVYIDEVYVVLYIRSLAVSLIAKGLEAYVIKHIWTR